MITKTPSERTIPGSRSITGWSPPTKCIIIVANVIVHRNVRIDRYNFNCSDGNFIISLLLLLLIVVVIFRLLFTFEYLKNVNVTTGVSIAQIDARSTSLEKCVTDAWL